MTVDAANAAAGATVGPSNPPPTKECDVIMKGGITSGVVFPLAIVELSKEYRFRNLGGTSAGGIAAAVAAAAEYNRDGGGFDRIKAVPKELGDNLMKLFQPSPSVKPLFDILIAAIDKPKPGEKAKSKLITIPLAIIMAYKSWALIGILPGLLILLFTWKLGWGWILFSLAIIAVGLIGALGLRLKRAAMSDLADNNYGLCTGATQDKDAYGHTAVTEWLADTIDECAGLKVPGQPGGKPLTFGDLAGKKIILEMMTTNLSVKRPYRLPFRNETYLYRKSDIEKLFPKRVVEYMLSPDVSRPFTVKDEKTNKDTAVDDFVHVPNQENLPVIFATRLSLSFPVLFTAIPLYACDFTLTNKKGPAEKQETREEQETRKLENKLGPKNTPRKCLFTDGGLSNNFPMQFFDSLWPNRPTFGIGLDEYTVERDRDFEKTNTETRVWMPAIPVGGANLPVGSIGGVFEFFASIIFTAKDWQDNLQSTQHGYRERIVHVALKPNEGGLNLNMPSETIKLISQFGAKAGDTLVHKFDLQGHRWRRFLVAMRRVEATLVDMQKAYNEAPLGGNSFEKFLESYPQQATNYRPDKPETAQQLRDRAKMLVDVIAAWRKQPAIPDKLVPHPESDLRITPKP
jgi:Patatin-like phospholipase